MPYTKPKISDVVESLGNAVNCLGSDFGQEFHDAFIREHRTLQQTMFGLFLSLIKRMATWEPYEYDGRNSYSQMMAKRITGLLSYYESVDYDSTKQAELAELNKAIEEHYKDNAIWCKTPMV